ncbi:MAG: transposase [Saprospiraceae bacterium]
MSGQRIIKRYSIAFKQKVVSEIESGKLTVSGARKVYDITGIGTIENWLKKLGKSHLLNKVVRIEMLDEKDKIKELEREKSALESALAQTQLKLLAMESLLETAEEHYGLDFQEIKKNVGMKPSAKPSTKSKSGA